jgi:hypothetical protein
MGLFLLVAALAGCGQISGPPSSTAAGMGPDSVNCKNQGRPDDPYGSIDCQSWDR